MTVDVHKFFFRDYVTPEILSYAVGDVWLYHFKETLVGVRHHANMTAFFMDLESLKTTKQQWVPTIELLKDSHIQDCLNEMDRTGETLEFLHIDEIGPKAMELVMAELAKAIDDNLTGKTG